MGWVKKSGGGIQRPLNIGKIDRVLEKKTVKGGKMFFHFHIVCGKGNWSEIPQKQTIMQKFIYFSLFIDLNHLQIAFSVSQIIMTIYN